MHASGYLRSVYGITIDMRSSIAAAVSSRVYQAMLLHTSAGIQYMLADTELVLQPPYKLVVYKKG
jgi:hypothetical protein